MIECANIYPGPNLKMRRGRRPARGRAVPSRRRREGMEQREAPRFELEPGNHPPGGWMAEAMESAAAWQPDPYRLDRTRQPRASAGAMPCAIRRREAGVCGGWQPWRARPQPPLSRAINARAAGRGPRATRHGRAALASPCPSVASAVALATARARLLLALCLPACI